MAHVCQVAGKVPMVGNSISHINNRARCRSLPDPQDRCFWAESGNRWVSLRISNAGLRLIDKKDIDEVLVDLRACGRV